MSANEKREDDLVPMRIVGLAMDPFNNSPIVLLRDKRPLFEIIAAMRKKRSAHLNEKRPKDDILQHDDFSLFSTTDDASETDEIYETDDLDDGFGTSDVSDVGDDADDQDDADDDADDFDTGDTSDDSETQEPFETDDGLEALSLPKEQTLDDLGAAVPEEEEEEALGVGTLDDLPSVLVEGGNEPVKEKSLEGAPLRNKRCVQKKSSGCWQRWKAGPKRVSRTLLLAQKTTKRHQAIPHLIRRRLLMK
jgi:hypothetical protein